MQLLITGAPRLDFETMPLYSLVLYAKDSQGATASQTVLIQIADVNEPPTFRGALAQRDRGTELSACGKKGPLGPDCGSVSWVLCALTRLWL